MKRTLKLYIVLSVIILLSTFLISACFLHDFAAFLGTWKNEDNGKVTTLTFEKSGEFVWSETDSQNLIPLIAKGSYTYNANAIYMTFSSDSYFNHGRQVTYIYFLSDFNKKLELGSSKMVFTKQ